jgi:hypothetical protein
MIWAFKFCFDVGILAFLATFSKIGQYFSNDLVALLPWPLKSSCISNLASRTFARAKEILQASKMKCQNAEKQFKMPKCKDAILKNSI